MSNCFYCGSQNTNKTTCPNNPNISINKMNFVKHLRSNKKLNTTLIDSLTDSKILIIDPNNNNYNNNNYNNNYNIPNNNNNNNNNYNNYNNNNNNKYNIPNNYNNLESEINLLENMLQSNNTHPAYLNQIMTNSARENMLQFNNNSPAYLNQLMKENIIVYLFEPKIEKNGHPTIKKGTSKHVFIGNLYSIPNVYNITNTEITTIDSINFDNVRPNISLSIENIKNNKKYNDFLKEKQIGQYASKKLIGPNFFYSNIIPNTYPLLISQIFPEKFHYTQLIANFKNYMVNLNRNKISEFFLDLSSNNYDMGITIMENLNNGTFNDYCKDEFTIHKTLENVNNYKCSLVCDKIKELEDSGIIHNDLNTKNIMFDNKFNPKIIDFGRSYLSEKISHEKIIELLNGRRKISKFVNQFVKICLNKKLKATNIPNNSEINEYNYGNDEYFTIILSFIINKKNISEKTNNMIIKNKNQIKNIIEKQYYIIDKMMILPGSFIPYLKKHELSEGFTPTCPE